MAKGERYYAMLQANIIEQREEDLEALRKAKELEDECLSNDEIKTLYRSNDTLIIGKKNSRYLKLIKELQAEKEKA